MIDNTLSISIVLFRPSHASISISLSSSNSNSQRHTHSTTRRDLLLHQHQHHTPPSRARTITYPLKPSPPPPRHHHHHVGLFRSRRLRGHLVCPLLDLLRLLCLRALAPRLLGQPGRAATTTTTTIAAAAQSLCPSPADHAGTISCRCPDAQA